MDDPPQPTTSAAPRDLSPKSKSIGVQTAHLPSKANRNLGRQLRERIRQLKLSLLNEKASKRRYAQKLIRIERLAKVQSCRRCDEMIELPVATKNFIEEQVTSQSKQVRWSESTVSMSQSLLYKSPSCYRKLQSYFFLPSTTTLYRRLPDAAKSVSYSHYLRFYDELHNLRLPFSLVFV